MGRPEEATSKHDRGYLPGLDAMRGVLVVVGLLYHARAPIFQSGFYFIDVFAILSGFLITKLLMFEHAFTGRVALKNFYMNRARRLLPVAYLTILCTILYAAVFERQILYDLRGETIAALTYTYNWYTIFVGADYFFNYATVPLQHLWTLSLEEQFYIIWPLTFLALFKFARPRRYYPALLLLTALFSFLIGYRVFFAGWNTSVTPPDTLEFLGRPANRLMFSFMSTFTRAGGFMVGAALGMWWRPEDATRPPVKHPQLLNFAGLLCLPAAFILLNMQWFTEDVYASAAAGGIVLTWVVSSLLIMALTQPGDSYFKRLILRKPLIRLGMVSYSLYLLHWPVAQFIRHNVHAAFPLWLIAILFPVLYLLSELLLRYVEKPIRRLGFTSWFRSIPSRAARVTLSVILVSATSISVVTLATADRPVNEVETAVNEAKDQVRPVYGNETVETIAYGDSIMLANFSEMSTRGIRVDAMTSRTFADGSRAAQALLERGAISDSLVMHLGVNEEITADQVRELLEAAKDLRRVVLLTIYRPNWEYTSANNEVLFSMVNEYPNLVVADFHALVVNNPSIASPDQIHLRSGEGARLYVDLIERSLSAESGGIVVK